VRLGCNKKGTPNNSECPYFLTSYQPGVRRREAFSFPLPASFSPEAFADALEEAPALQQVVACAPAGVEPEGVVPALIVPAEACAQVHAVPVEEALVEPQAEPVSVQDDSAAAPVGPVSVQDGWAVQPDGCSEPAVPQAGLPGGDELARADSAC
jgi:hypothetical protein